MVTKNDLERILGFPKVPIMLIVKTLTSLAVIDYSFFTFSFRENHVSLLTADTSGRRSNCLTWTEMSKLEYIHWRHLDMYSPAKPAGLSIPVSTADREEFHPAGEFANITC